MTDLHSMSVRDLIMALAEAEDAARSLRSRGHSETDGSADYCIPWASREDAIVTELRRRSEVPRRW
jgi:hypothetical protein